VSLIIAGDATARLKPVPRRAIDELPCCRRCREVRPHPPPKPSRPSCFAPRSSSHPRLHMRRSRATPGRGDDVKMRPRAHAGTPAPSSRAHKQVRHAAFAPLTPRIVTHTPLAAAASSAYRRRMLMLLEHAGNVRAAAGFARRPTPASPSIAAPTTPPPRRCRSTSACAASPARSESSVHIMIGARMASRSPTPRIAATRSRGGATSFGSAMSHARRSTCARKRPRDGVLGALWAYSRPPGLSSLRRSARVPKDGKADAHVPPMLPRLALAPYRRDRASRVGFST